MAESEYKTTIKITGEDAGAERLISRISGTLGGLKKGLLTIRSAISSVMKAFGLFYLAAEGVRMVVSAVKQLREWMNRAATAAKELHDRLTRESIAAATAQAAEAYKRLNKELEEANRLERERNQILDQRKATQRDLEDASLERNKQMEIAALDPTSATYAEDKAAVERKYARRASDVAAARADEDSRAGAKKLYAEADMMDRQANQKETVYQQAARAEERARENSWRLTMAARNGGEAEKKAAEEADQAWKSAYDAAKKIKDEIDQMRREADSLRNRAGEMTGGFLAGRIRNSANQLRIDNEERDAAAKKAEAERQEQERAAEAERKAQERERAQQEKAAQRERVEEATGALKRTEMLQNGIMSVAPSGNRLTAMGLGAGSGVARVQERMAESLKDLVKLGQQQIEELKQIKDGEDVAVFAD